MGRAKRGCGWGDRSSPPKKREIPQHRWVSWEVDGEQLGTPSATDILVKWLVTPGNYQRWREGKQCDVLQEIAAILETRGCVRRSPASVRNKIRDMEKQYVGAKNYLLAMKVREDYFKCGAVDVKIDAAVRRMSRMATATATADDKKTKEDDDGSEKDHDDSEKGHDGSDEGVEKGDGGNSSLVGQDYEHQEQEPTTDGACSTTCYRFSASSVAASHLLIHETMRESTRGTVNVVERMRTRQESAIRHTTEDARREGGCDLAVLVGKERRQRVLEYEAAGKQAHIETEVDTHRKLAECAMASKKARDKALLACDVKTKDDLRERELEHQRDQDRIALQVKTLMARKDMADAGISMEEINRRFP
ncbi:hypothetical protein BBJ28_00011784 [Nothophytophthora sp. Chile5]|nr:hypothetical protein BBJ28_00011784 [Nothophytophthora sp. Chile5]